MNDTATKEYNKDTHCISATLNKASQINHASDSQHMLEPKSVTIVPADVLAPDGARASASTMMTDLGDHFKNA